MADSYNELFGLGSHSADASLETWLPLQDDAASTAVADQTGQLTATLLGGDNTSAKTTTGPNSWLTKAFALNGSDDKIQVASPPSVDGSAVTVLLRTNLASNGPGQYYWCNHAAGDAALAGRLWYIDTLGTGRMGMSQTRATTNRQLVSADFFVTAGAWTDVSLRDGTGTLASGVSLYNNGSPPGAFSTTTNSAGAITADGGSWSIGGRLIDSLRQLNASVADFSLLSREITDAEETQWRLGPEPINSVAPVASGTARVNSTLSVTTGTWGLDSPFASGTNGTITYAYQWTRSDDAGGTGEADISGATSSTYTLVEADETKFVRCRVRASNDGGFDAAADTNSNMSIEIASSSTGGGLLRRGNLSGIIGTPLAGRF